jgi:hypothetical protein
MNEWGGARCAADERHLKERGTDFLTRNTLTQVLSKDAAAENRPFHHPTQPSIILLQAELFRDCTGTFLLGGHLGWKTQHLARPSSTIDFDTRAE